MTKPKTKHPNPIDVYVGSRVRMRRFMLNLSQEKLGKALGITFQQVQKYEKGVNRMGSSRLQQAADILGVTVHQACDVKFFLANSEPSTHGHITTGRLLRADRR